MKRLIVIMGLVFVAVAGWRIADRLSSDALGMAIGVLFGIVAGIPTALLLLASGRRRTEEEDERLRPARQGQLPQNGYGYGAYPQQPPVIVLAGHPAPAPHPVQQGYPGYDPQPRYALPGPRELPEERKFKVVGEKEEMIDEW